jgi:hypothetical protein
LAFIANGEATKPVEPRERALDDPAEHAKAATVGRAATAEDRNNDAGGEAITMWLRIVATIPLQDVRPSARPPAASNGGQVRDQGAEVGDVVDVRGVTCATSGTPRIGHDVVFGPRLGAIGWVRSFFSPAHRADRPAVHHRPALVEPSPSAQLGEEGLTQATPGAGPFPLHQASPARAA